MWTRALTAMLMVVVTGCAASGEAGNDDTSSRTGHQVQLDCDRDGYPCSWSEVDPAVIEATLEAAEGADRRFTDGRSPDQVHDWLQEQPDVVDVLADEGGARFRLEGGRPMWIGTDLTYSARHASDVAVPGEPAVGDTPSPPTSVAATRRGAFAPLPRSGPVRARPVDVVGDDPEDKRALILAPYAWDFEPYDESDEVASILRSTRGYDGNVELKVNGDPGRATVTPSDFAGWEQYDVVHVSTHGQQVCDTLTERCHTSIAAGEFAADQDNASVDETFASQNQVGVDYTAYDGGFHVSLSTDWFRKQFPDGLDDTLVWISACETGKNDDLAEALIGESGVFAGWSEPVYSDDAQTAALDFYGHLSQTGLPTTDGFERLDELGLDESPDEDTGLISRLTHRSGADLRIREIVELQHPQTGATLHGGGPPTFVERQDADLLPVRVAVDGVDEGEAGEFTVDLTVDTVTVLSTRLNAPPPHPDVDVRITSDGSSYLISGRVPLPFRVEDYDGTIDLRAVVDPLPEDGRSEHHVRSVPITTELTVEFDTTLRQDAPGGLTVEVESTIAVDISSPSDGSGRLTGEQMLRWDETALVVPPNVDCRFSGIRAPKAMLVVRDLRLDGRDERLTADLKLGVEARGTSDPNEQIRSLHEHLADRYPDLGIQDVPAGPMLPILAPDLEHEDGGCTGSAGGVTFGPGFPVLMWYATFVIAHDYTDGIRLADGWQPGTGPVLLERTEDWQERVGDVATNLETTVRLVVPDTSPAA